MTAAEHTYCAHSLIGDPPDATSALVHYDSTSLCIDCAWQEAEAALPEGWEIARTTRVRMSGLEAMQRWEAMAAPIKPRGRDWRSQYVVQYADGPTPAAALRALAQKLREAR